MNIILKSTGDILKMIVFRGGESEYDVVKKIQGDKNI